MRAKTKEAMSRERLSTSWLYTSPAGTILPPVETREQSLPFENLLWQDFEKLCYRLVRLEHTVELCTPYGVAGQKQDGIDIFARLLHSNKYRVFQCKNERGFGPEKILTAVKEFKSGEWFERSEAFVLCTRESLRSTERAREVERQAADLRKAGVALLSWDREELSVRLKSHPELIDDFFGRAWVKVVCGDEVASELGDRLDVKGIATLRGNLRSLYERIFHLHDRGIPMADTLPLSRRYVVPDIKFDQVIEIGQSENLGSVETEDRLGRREPREQQLPKLSQRSSRQYAQRLRIEHWIGKNNRHLLFGGPGAGKSTFLRYLAMDILSQEPHLEHVAERWGSFTPIWVPFALWTRMVNQGQISDRSVKGIATACIKSWDAEDLTPMVERAFKDKRLLLMVDGLDEYSDIEAAKIALNHLESFIEQHEVAVIATSRPHGFDKLGLKPDGWLKGHIADLSSEQQKELATVWFEASSKRVSPDLERDARTIVVERQVLAFFGQLARSHELRELAGNPLLLCLLISFQISNVRLPIGRFRAYQALTDHLVSTHPERRRVAAESPSQSELPDEQLRFALAYLAQVIHERYPEGIIPEQEAEECIVEFVTDDQQGFGLNRIEAARIGRFVLSKTEDVLGIIVKRSHDDVGFYHRTIQEYLVSLNLSRLSLAEQCQIVSHRCVDFQWREVILGLLQITKRPGDIRNLIQSIRGRKLNRVEEQGVEDLLSEVAFGDYNCPADLAREIAGMTLKQIESGTWLPQRQQCLLHALDGLRSPTMAPMVKGKIEEWFPDRVGWGKHYIFDAMARWKPADDVIESLFIGLNSEEYRAKMSASSTLSKLASGSVSVGDRLIHLVNFCDEPDVVAACLRALIGGWRDHPSLPSLIERCADSSSPSLKLVGIRGRIQLKSHSRRDFEGLLGIADRNSRTDYSLRGEIASVLLEGWPNDEGLKKECLRSLRQMHRWDSPGKCIDNEIALRVVLIGYAMDDEVIDYCAGMLRGDTSPFFSISHEAFHLLAKNFSGASRLIKALDEWVTKAAYQSIEKAYGALVGRTHIFKKQLIEDLDGSFPHWPAKALLEGWGMEDDEVRLAISRMLNGGSKHASNVAHLITKIIPDKNECRQRLLVMLRDRDCVRPDFVMDGLVDLGVDERDSAIVDIALPMLEAGHDLFINDVKSTLISYYGFDPRVRDLALRTLEGRGDVYTAVAFAFGDDSEVRSRLLQIVNPLPTSLRQTIASYLSEAEIDNSFAMSILDVYDHEVNEEIKVTSSIGYHTRLLNSGGDLSGAVERLRDTIDCIGHDFEERRLAAFSGLLVLDRLDILIAKNSNIQSVRGFDINIPHVKHLLKHWKKLNVYFGAETFWKRICEHYSGAYVWNKLALLADEYPDARNDVLAFLIQCEPKIAESESLGFLSRVEPASNLLLEYCLNTVGLLRKSTSSAPRDSNVNVRLKDKILAAEILGEHFGGNEEVLKRILSYDNKHMVDELVMVLSEGWPASKELDSLFQEMVRTGNEYWESTVITYYALRGDPERVFQEIKKLIALRSSVPEFRDYGAIFKAIIRRLEKDDEAVALVMRDLLLSTSASEKITFSMLIYKARGLTEELRQWADVELVRQLSGIGSEAGMNLVTGKVVSVPHAIFEMSRTRWGIQ